MGQSRGSRLPGQAPSIEVSAGSALDDPHFAAATHDQRSAASLVHLRWATTGIAVRPENSHPFLADRIAMAHNGSIKPIGQLDELLEPEIAATIRGSTDSERYFAVIRQHRASSPNLAEAVRRAVSQLRELYPDASLNALILGEDQLIAVHAHARSRLPDEDIAEITAADLPAEHLEDYFGMRWARPAEDRVVIASTGFGDLDWQPLPVGERDRDLDVRPVDGDPSADDSVDAMTDDDRRGAGQFRPADAEQGRAPGRPRTAGRLSERRVGQRRPARRTRRGQPADGAAVRAVARLRRVHRPAGRVCAPSCRPRSSGPITRLPDAPPAGGLLDRLLQQARAQNERATETLAALPTSALDAAVALLSDTGRADLPARRTLLASAGRAPGRPPRTAASRGAVARRSGPETTSAR